MPFELPQLAYSYNALEPHISAQTMTFHHDKHHAGYTSNLNSAIAGTDFESKSIEELLGGLEQLPEKIRAAVRNNGGGYANHSLFWEVIGPNGGGEPSGALAEAITDAFGSFSAFKDAFENAAKSRFGSGWAWLYVDADGSLKVTSTANQDTPLMDGKTPILGLDVWEHAYYLDYQNRRPDYVSAFWNIVKWDAVEQRYLSAR
jgi:superoxide dismutase, Fe-Mn family